MNHRHQRSGPSMNDAAKAVIEMAQSTAADTAPRYRLGVIKAQSAFGDGKTKHLVVPNGEPFADGYDYTIVTPYVSTIATDSQGKPVAGAPQPNDPVLLRDLGDGTWVVEGKRTASATPPPFVAGITPGTGLKSTAYADPNVLMPTLAIDTSQVLAWTNGLQIGNAPIDFQSNPVQFKGAVPKTAGTPTASGTIPLTFNGVVFNVLVQ